MLEMVFALQNDWTEVLDLAEGILIFLTRSLQEREKYKALTQVARRLYPSAGTLRLGLDSDGKKFTNQIQRSQGNSSGIIGLAVRR